MPYQIAERQRGFRVSGLDAFVPAAGRTMRGAIDLLPAASMG